jgi:hypothetical protein
MLWISGQALYHFDGAVKFILPAVDAAGSREGSCAGTYALRDCCQGQGKPAKRKDGPKQSRGACAEGVPQDSRSRVARHDWRGSGTLSPMTVLGG